MRELNKDDFDAEKEQYIDKLIQELPKKTNQTDAKIINLPNMKDIFKQSCNVYPKIMIKDLQSGRQFEFGKNTHDRLVISEDGRTLSYYNMQNDDGSRYGDYRFEYEKPSVEEYGENIADADFYARMVENENLPKTT